MSPRFVQDQSLLAATGAGVHLSTSAGKRWDVVGPSVGALCVAIGPETDDGFVGYAGTVIGLYRTEDGGQTWHETTLAPVPVLEVSLSEDYATDGMMMVGTLAGAYLSDDWGETWSGPWFSEEVAHDVAVLPGYGADGLLAIGTDSGVYISTDRGANWDGPMLDETAHALAAAPGFSEGSTLFAGFEGSGVYGSGDAGATWDPKSMGISAVSLRAVVTSPLYRYDRTALAGGPLGVWRTVDDGGTWAATDLDYAEANALVCWSQTGAPLHVYAATNGGVFASDDAGETWSPASGDLTSLSVADIAADDSGVLWAATGDAGVFRSDDGGQHWSPKNEGLSSLEMSSIDWLGTSDEASVLVAGTLADGAYVSMDGGDFWSEGGATLDGVEVLSVAGARGYGSLFWTFAGTDAGLWRSGDLGTSWDFAGFLGQDIRAISLYPDYIERPNCYLGTGSEGVFRSLNGGVDVVAAERRPG